MVRFGRVPTRAAMVLCWCDEMNSVFVRRRTPRTRESVSDHRERMYLTLLLILTFGTGVIDAASYVGLHQVFTANMTGNVVFVGLGIAGFADLPVIRASIALGAFIAGAVLVGRVQRHLPRDLRSPRSSGWLLIAAATSVAFCGVIHATLPDSTLWLDVMTGALGISMGIQAGVAKRVAVSDVSTVVVTMTLASWAVDSRIGRDKKGFGRRRTGAVGAMMLGAVVGAVLLKIELILTLALSTVLITSVGFCILIMARRDARRAAVPEAVTASQVASH